MVERIRELCKRDGTNFSAVEKELGFANASLKKTTGAIQADRLYALARRFDVSMEYLLTGIKDEHIKKDEKEMLDVYRELSPEKRMGLIEYARYMKDTQKKTDSSKVG